VVQHIGQLQLRGPPPRPADPNALKEAALPVVRQLLPLLQLGADLQLDTLTTACMRKLLAMPRQQLAGVLEGRWGELVALGGELGVELFGQLVAVLRV
jgi:hypothetical protein